MIMNPHFLNFAYLWLYRHKQLFTVHRLCSVASSDETRTCSYHPREYVITLWGLFSGGKKKLMEFLFPKWVNRKKSLQDANTNYRRNRHNIERLVETGVNKRNPSNSIGRISFWKLDFCTPRYSWANLLLQVTVQMGSNFKFTVQMENKNLNTGTQN